MTNMIYQAQVTVELKGSSKIQNYVTNFNFNEDILVSDFKQEIKGTVKLLDTYDVDKETLYYGNKELKDDEKVPVRKSGLQYYLVVTNKQK